MDTHIKNGPLDAFRTLFDRLKGARPTHSKGVAAVYPRKTRPTTRWSIVASSERGNRWESWPRSWEKNAINRNLKMKSKGGWPKKADNGFTSIPQHWCKTLATLPRNSWPPSALLPLVVRESIKQRKKWVKIQDLYIHKAHTRTNETEEREEERNTAVSSQ